MWYGLWDANDAEAEAEARKKIRANRKSNQDSYTLDQIKKISGNKKDNWRSY